MGPQRNTEARSNDRARSPINEFELVENDLKIRISKNGHGQVTVMSAPQLQAMPQLGYAPQMPAVPQMQQAAPATVPESRPTPPTNTVEIKAPMVGTFYRAPSPDAESYVRVGDVIEPGRVLCIIEAMKLMNEIEAEIKGRIVDIVAENALPVEFGQVMFQWTNVHKSSRCQSR
ncbi:MAG: acetyl-CoA carboxylase biotin carboxyl carrier protein [bacterium]|nr:acetyl-CoA carboxylase biotin carboxyl carrier protein [bacterium]